MNKKSEPISEVLEILKEITDSSDEGCMDQSSGFYFRDVAKKAEKILKELSK